MTFRFLQALSDTGNGLGGGGGSSSGGAVSHFEPQVAMLCDAGPHGQEAYHPKYMSEQGEWVSDLYSKASCFKDKMDILNYCKKVSLLFNMSFGFIPSYTNFYSNSIVLPTRSCFTLTTFTWMLISDSHFLFFFFMKSRLAFYRIIVNLYINQILLSWIKFRIEESASSKFWSYNLNNIEAENQ